jgi:hypothetical protein
VLYEAPFVVDDTRPPVPADIAQQLDRLVTAGKRGAAIRLFMTKGVALNRLERRQRPLPRLVAQPPSRSTRRSPRRPYPYRGPETAEADEMNVSDDSHISGEAPRARLTMGALAHGNTACDGRQRPLIDHECPPGRRD